MNPADLYTDPSKIDWNNPVVIDFESYYDNLYNLSKITTEKYIRGDQWECIGVSIKIGDKPAKFYRRETGLSVIAELVNSLPTSPFISHNNSFDMAVLGLRYGIHPNFMVDTSIMAKLCAFDRVAGGTSLAKLAAQLRKMGLGNHIKGTTVYNMLGVHADDMSDQQWQEYGDYCLLDSTLCYDLYMYMIDKVPIQELIMVDITTKMYTKPMFNIDVPLLQNYANQLEEERVKMLERIAGQLGFESNEALLSNLRSSKKFTALLERLNVTVPMKWSEKKKEMIPAVSKTDIEFLDLLEHEDELVRTLVETKLGTSSNMEQTRTATFLDIASRGLAPVYLQYASAHTGRYGGGQATNYQNMSKRTKDPVLRRSLRAMDGFVVLASDSGQIECRINGFMSNQQDLTQLFLDGRDPYVDMATAIFNRPYDEILHEAKVVGSKEGKKMRNLGKEAVLACIGEGTEVLTLRGWVAIQHVQAADLLWDGESWVTHGGVVSTGTKSCYNVNNIYLTADHRIYDGRLWKSFDDLDDGDGTQEYGYWWYATAENWAIANLPEEVVESWEKDGLVHKLWCVPETDRGITRFSNSWKSACVFEVMQTYDILNVGKNNRFFIRSSYYDVVKPTYLCVHNCGYGMSANTFRYRMELTGNTEAAEMADDIVRAYRTKNNRIVGFWHECDRVLDVLLSGGSLWFGGPNNNLFYADGSSEFHGKKIPSIRLPNGTYIWYQNLRKEMDDSGGVNYVYDQFKGRTWLHKRIWGSSLVENLCQALSFAILKYQAIEIAKTGCPVNLNVHDEWVSVVPLGQVGLCAAIHYKAMKSVPDYIPAGLLDCEVDVGLNYADLKTVDVSKYIK